VILQCESRSKLNFSITLILHTFKCFCRFISCVFHGGVVTVFLHHNLLEHCYFIIEETVRFSNSLHHHFHFLITKIDLLAVV